MSIATIERDITKAFHPAYIETIVVNRDNPKWGPTIVQTEEWVSLSFDGLNGILSAGSGTFDPLPPLTITEFGARQLGMALLRLADRMREEAKG